MKYNNILAASSAGVIMCTNALKVSMPDEQVLALTNSHINMEAKSQS